MRKLFNVKVDYKSNNGASILVGSNRKLFLIKLAFVALLLSTVVIFIYQKVSQKTSSELSHEEYYLDEPIALPMQAEQAEQTDEAELIMPDYLNWSTYQVRKGDTLASLLIRLNVSQNDIVSLLSIPDHSRYLKNLFPGQVIQIQVDEQGKLIALKQQIDSLRVLEIRRQDDNFIADLNSQKVESRIAFGSAFIQDSLFIAGKRSHLEDKLIMELASIFAYDIDFALDIQPNDSFKILYEEKYVNGEKVGVGSILAAEFINQGKTYRAIRFTTKDGKSEYFAADGSSLRKAFIRTPVKYTRISSHFNLKRLHPILHKIRAHKGVDYAAPRGTPVKASGHGKVAFIGKKGGYGNVIILQHGHKYSTLYGHLSGFRKSIKLGAKVSQGDVIGYVGSTGLATAPHLHYEFRINGVHHDPLTVALPNGENIAPKYKAEFFAEKSKLLALMEYQDRVTVASKDAH